MKELESVQSHNLYKVLDQARKEFEALPETVKTQARHNREIRIAYEADEPMLRPAIQTAEDMLKSLVKEAKTHKKSAHKRFQKSNDPDDHIERDHWRRVIEWLGSKL